MRNYRPTRIVAATLITGSALFGLAPAASADETSGPSKPADRTRTSQQAPNFPSPPANAPKFVKRFVKQVNKFFEQNRGPVNVPRWEPGNPNNPTVICHVFGRC